MMGIVDSIKSLFVRPTAPAALKLDRSNESIAREEQMRTFVEDTAHEIDQIAKRMMERAQEHH